jgi:CelD/BcsL family acetyltransferase involved in cellulose biosynthesis
MDVIEITCAAKLASLQKEWAALWQRCPSAGPFQHPDWLLPWWRLLGGGELWTLAVRDAGALVALAPLYIHTEGNMRQLTLLGNGTSDSCDLLVEPDRRDATHAMFARIARAAGVWTCCDFRDVPAGSPLVVDLPQLPEHFAAILASEAPCPVLALTDTTADLAGLATRSLLSNLRQCRRRAESVGAVTVEHADDRCVQPALTALFGLHHARWATRGEAGVLGDAALQSFHREIAERFLRRGWLRMLRLLIADETAAMSYGFSLRGRGYLYIGGFEPRFAHFSPGSLAIQQAIVDAKHDGAREFDFLRGSEPYKYRWGARDRPQFRVRIGNNAGAEIQ